MTAVKVDSPPPFYSDIEPALRKLNEKELRTRVMPELLGKLRFFDLQDRHGPMELGKDLVAWRHSPVDTRDWYAFILKSESLNTKVGHVAGIRTVLHQVEQSLDHEILDPLTSMKSLVRECWVVTTGDIPGRALDEVASTLQRHHLDRMIRWIGVKTLAHLLMGLPRRTLESMLNLEPLGERTEHSP